MKWSVESKINPETGLPRTWQKPKENHPWRQYENRKVNQVEEPRDVVGIKDFLKGVVDNWDKVEVVSFTAMGDRTYTLSQVSQKKAAAYICGVLKRNYIQ